MLSIALKLSSIRKQIYFLSNYHFKYIYFNRIMIAFTVTVTVIGAVVLSTLHIAIVSTVFQSIRMNFVSK